MTIAPAQKPAPRRHRFFRSVSALILREMVTTYGRSPGGYLWMILEPVAGIALLSFIFGLIARSPAIGTNFALFFGTGILIFNLYQAISSMTANAIKFSRAFLAYPSVTFLDVLIARILLNTLTQMLVMVIILSGVIMIYDLNVILRWGPIFNAIGMTLMLAISIGVLNCYLFAILPLWERLWTVLTRPMFILSGILFIPENVPMTFREYYMFLPWAHTTSEMRKGFFSTYEAAYADPTYVYLLSLGILVLGLLLLLRNHKIVAYY